MIKYQLSKGFYTIIDYKDLNKMLECGKAWFVSNHKYTRYAVSDFTIKNSNKKKRVYLHRWLLDPPAGTHVDHINGDGLDNRRCNLRIVTPSQNNRNRTGPSRSSSGYRGVQRREFVNGPRYKAYFNERVDGRTRQISLGTYSTPELAACARDYHVVDNGHTTTKLNFQDSPHSRQEVVSDRSTWQENEHPGIKFRPGRGRWEVEARIGGRRTYVGRYQTFSEAVQAQYDFYENHLVLLPI